MTTLLQTPPDQAIPFRRVVSTDKQTFNMQRVAEDDPGYAEWATERKYRQSTPTEHAKLNPFDYIVRTGAWVQYLHKHGRAPEEDQPDPIWPEMPDEILALWVWRCADGQVKQAYVINRFEIPRTTLGRLVSHWKRFGLLPFRDRPAPPQ